MVNITKQKALKAIQKYQKAIFLNHMEEAYTERLLQASSDLAYVRTARSEMELENLVEKYRGLLNDFNAKIGVLNEEPDFDDLVEETNEVEKEVNINIIKESEGEANVNINVPEDVEVTVNGDEVIEEEPEVKKDIIYSKDEFYREAMGDPVTEDELIQVEETDDSLEAQTKATNARTNILRNIFYVTGAAACVAIIISATSCALSKKHNNGDTIISETTTNNNNDDVVITVPTSDDTVIVIEPEVEPEKDIDELITEALEGFNGGESTIRFEDYKFMLEYANNNLDKEISVDSVVEGFINPLLITVNNEMMQKTNEALGVIDGGYDTGNFKVSDLILKDTITKEKLLDLDAIKDGLKDENPEVQKQAAEMLMYIMYDINNQVANSKETVIINGKEFEGYTIMGRTFDKYYNTEFYELNDSSDQTIYLSYVAALLPTAQAILGEKPTIGNQVKLIDGDEIVEVSSKETLESLQYDIYVGECETEEGFQFNLFSSVVDASVKESNNTLGIEGNSIILR